MFGFVVHLGDPWSLGWEGEGPGEPSVDLAPQRGVGEPVTDCETVQL